MKIKRKLSYNIKLPGIYVIIFNVPYIKHLMLFHQNFPITERNSYRGITKKN